MTDRNTDHNTVVVREGGGSSTGVILGVVIIVIVLAAIWYFAVGPGAGSGGAVPDVNIDVNLPSIGIPAAS